MKGIGAWEWPATGKFMFNVLAQFITKPFSEKFLRCYLVLWEIILAVKGYLYFQDGCWLTLIPHPSLGKRWDLVRLSE